MQNRIKYLFLLLLLCGCLKSSAQHDVPVTNEFRITGLVKKEITFRISDIGHYRQDSLGDLIIRNRKGDEKSRAKNLKGILLKTLLDAAGIVAEKPKDYASIVIKLTASDGFVNVFSWNELFNTEIGDHVYMITEMNGLDIAHMPERILVFSMADINQGSRHLKGLTKVELLKAE